jgi:hypothetical protein
MRRRILVIIGLDLNDAAADPVDEQCGANQLRGHKMHGAGKKVSTELTGGHAAISYGEGGAILEGAALTTI